MKEKPRPIPTVNPAAFKFDDVLDMAALVEGISKGKALEKAGWSGTITQWRAQSISRVWACYCWRAFYALAKMAGLSEPVLTVVWCRHFIPEEAKHLAGLIGPTVKLQRKRKIRGKKYEGVEDYIERAMESMASTD